MGNKRPKLVDYLQYEDLLTPLSFISDSKSYIEFLAKVEKDEELKTFCKDEVFIKAIRFVEYLLPVKRVYEFVVLKYLLSHDYVDEKIASSNLKKYLNKINNDTILHSFNFLNQDYFDKAQVSRYLKIVELKDEKLVKSKSYIELDFGWNFDRK